MSDMRKEYRQLSPDEVAAINKIKETLEEVAKVVDENCKDIRCNMLARTKLEEAAMWAVKGITA